MYVSIIYNSKQNNCRNFTGNFTLKYLVNLHLMIRLMKFIRFKDTKNFGVFGGG